MHTRIAAFVSALLLVPCGGANAADAALGKAKVDGQCSECHESEDWAEEDAGSLAAKIKDVVDGKVKHKAKLKLTDEEIAGIAAYWAGAAK